VYFSRWPVMLLISKVYLLEKGRRSGCLHLPSYLTSLTLKCHEYLTFNKYTILLSLGSTSLHSCHPFCFFFLLFSFCFLFRFVSFWHGKHIPGHRTHVILFSCGAELGCPLLMPFALCPADCTPVLLTMTWFHCGNSTCGRRMPTWDALVRASHHHVLHGH
jgi:hypothetical protein